MTFEEWFEKNRDELAQLLCNDAEEALWRAWFAGMEHGMNGLAETFKEIWAP